MLNITGSGEKLTDTVQEKYNVDLRDVKDINELRDKLLTVNNTPKGIIRPLKPYMNFATSNQVGSIADYLGIGREGYRTAKESVADTKRQALAERRPTKEQFTYVKYKDYFVTKQFDDISTKREYFLRQPKGFKKCQMVDTLSGKILGWEINE